MSRNSSYEANSEADVYVESSPLLASERTVNSRDVSVKNPGCITTRYVLVLFGFLGFMNVYMMRVNLNVAIVAMANNTQDTNHSHTGIISDCPAPAQLNDTKTNTHSTAPTFQWDANMQGQILGAFYYGYIITQIPGGWLAGRYGAKWIYGIGILCTSVLTLITPVTVTSGGVVWFIALRVLEGICEGVTFPAMYAMMARWAPPFERTTMLILTCAGADFGTIVATPIAGILCDSNFLQGWPSAFYIFGIMGIIWFIFWCIFIHDTPSKHPRISKEERDYIEKSIGFQGKTTLYVPVISIITSIPVWAIIISHFCVSYGNKTILIDLPTYFKNFLLFDISQSGILSALPAILRWIFYIMAAYIADYLRQHRYLSTRATRKLFTSIGMLIPGLSLAMVAFVGCSKPMAVSFLCIAGIGLGIVTSGYGVNQLDIAPRYAGFIMGVTNTVGNLTGFLVPTIMGFLTEGNNTKERWQIVFWICSGLLSISFIAYLLMGQGEEQSWAKMDSNSLSTAAEDSDATQHPEHHSINRTSKKD